MKEKNKIKPLTPADVKKKKLLSFPDEVIEAFNELILENWEVNSARVEQEDVIVRIMEKMNCKESAVIDNHYLDIEDLFRKAGWKVEYDKPGYNENYEPYFQFTKKR